MPRKASNYANGLQYKIVCNDPSISDCYNGSCVSFKDRKCRHKSTCNNPNADGYNLKIYRFIREHGGWANWTMIQLELYPCKTEQELVKREREIFDILKPTLNMISPTLDVEKKKKNSVKYYADNRVEINAKQKQYIDEHRDEINAKQNQYYAEHKVEIAAKHKQKVKCVCRCVSSKNNLSKHQRTQKHLYLMAKK
jgi:hypothetical protein